MGSGGGTTDGHLWCWRVDLRRVFQGSGASYASGFSFVEYLYPPLHQHAIITIITTFGFELASRLRSGSQLSPSSAEMILSTQLLHCFYVFPDMTHLPSAQPYRSLPTLLPSPKPPLLLVLRIFLSPRRTKMGTSDTRTEAEAHCSLLRRRVLPFLIIEFPPFLSKNEAVPGVRKTRPKHADI